MPSNNSNGNTFDFQGRQLSCEHLMRRVVRYELDGSITVLADSFEGKRLNSPNDVVPHPDGSYWFTDPPYGGQLYEGAPDVAGGPTNAVGTAEAEARPGGGHRRMAARAADQCYRVDPSGRLDLVITEEPGAGPERPVLLARLQEALRHSTGKGPGDQGPGGKGDLHVFDVGADNKLSNGSCSRTAWSTA